MAGTPDGPAGIPISEVEVDRSLPGRVVIAVRGDLDLTGVPAHSGTFRDASREGRHLVVDLRETRFLDSSGLSLLMNAARRTTVAGLHLLVVCGPGPVHQVLEMTGLLETLRVQPDIDVAHRMIDEAPHGPYRGPSS